ncbi:OTU domain-containing protein 4 isoform X4 [Silurus meridionalis]|nr:OTU domain-containing protein 4 isoform X4 [Silurus meridionalis]
MESGAGANTQQGEEKRVEQLMDEYLKANGLYRKKIAKDGSCLFRAVAEQVLHSQGLHTRVRTECVKYLRQKRDLYESFIEGDFEEYLQMLQDPQSWVGQVEISALSVLYKHDFIIYQIPGEPPVNITENSYPDKGRGRGQTRGVGRGRLPRAVQDSLNPSCLRNVQYNVWLRSKRVQQRRDFCMAAGMHYKAGDKCQVRLNNTDRFYSAYIQDVSPDDGPVTVFIEELGQKYNVPLWNLRTPSEDAWSTVTEKNKRHTASSSSNGPTGFVPDYPHAVFNCLCSIDKTPGFVPDYPHAVKPQDSFQTTPMQSSKPQDSFQTTPMQSSKPQDSFQTTPMQSSKPQDSFQTTPMQSSTDRAPSTKPQDSFQTTPMQSSTDTASSTRPIVLLENTSSVSSQCSTTQCLTGPKPIPVTTVSSPRNSPRDTDSTFVVTTAVSLTPEAVTTLIASQTTTTTAPSDPVPTPLSHLLISQTASEPSHALSQSTSATPQDPVLTSKITFAAAVPCSTDAPAALKTPESAAVPAQPALSPGPPYPVGFGHLPYPPYPPYPAAMPSLSPNIPAPMPDPCLPPAVPTPPYSHATESYLYEHTVSPVAASAGGALVSDPPPESSITFEQLCQERLYPGFPQNEKGEPVQTPLFSDHKSGKDLPNDTSVLRFFFNLGVKAYMYQMLPPLTYLAPLVQAYQHTPLNISPSPGSWQPENNSRPIYSSPNPSPARPAHFDVRGVPSSMDVGVFGHPSLPMQMSLPVVSHPTVYAGMCSVPPAGPSLQYSAPQHHSVPPPGLYGMEMHRPTVPPIMEGGQGVHSSMTAQLEKAFWAGQNQHHLEGGDIKPGGVPVTVEMHSSGAQVAVGGQSKGVEPTLLANGNRQEISVGFIGPPLEGWKTEFGTDPKTVRSYQSPSYRSGGRHGQNDRGGYRGRGTRERRENTGWVRHDGQMLYHRGSGGRSRGRSYTNTRATGYPGGHCAPES